MMAVFDNFTWLHIYGRTMQKNEKGWANYDY